jgi:3-oxoacyl-[acyl-carrier protein] reductase
MKYALVTGASRGIGRSTALELAKMGYPVIVNYLHNKMMAQETQKMITDLGGTAQLLPFDVACETDVNQALDVWESTYPNDKIEVLVNNAGIRKDNLMVFMDSSDWHAILNIHLNGFFYTTRRLLSKMITNKYGRIVNVVSLSGLKGLPGQTNYSAAKAGIIGASKALAQEVARKNVTVNCVAPGFIATDMTQELDEQQLCSLIPMHRFGKVEEVAHAVAFLASPQASYITGEVISINGGLYT